MVDQETKPSKALAGIVAIKTRGIIKKTISFKMPGRISKGKVAILVTIGKNSETFSMLPSQKTEQQVINQRE